MAYNTKNIIRDASGAPIPQFYNPAADAYQSLTGVDLGGGRYGYDGLIWGKTAGGLYVPAKVADDGTMLTQLTGSKLQVVNLNLDLSASLAAGTSEVNLVYASTGFLVENLVYAFDCNPPVGATTGWHRLLIEIANSEAVGGRILDMQMPYNVNFALSNGIQMQSGTPLTVLPSAEQIRLQLLTLAAKAISTGIPLKFTYSNNTDVAQTNLRKLRVKKYERAVI